MSITKPPTRAEPPLVSQASTLFASAKVLLPQERYPVDPDGRIECSGPYHAHYGTYWLGKWTRDVLAETFNKQCRAPTKWVVDRLDGTRTRVLFREAENARLQAEAVLHEPLVLVCPEPLAFALQDHVYFGGGHYGLAEERTILMVKIQDVLFELRGTM